MNTPRTNTFEQRKALLQAVKLLADNGHLELAQAVWEAETSKKRVLLPGEHQ